MDANAPPENRFLTTTDAVMDVLGGNPGVAKLTGRTPKAVSQWRGWDHFPPEFFCVMTDALAAIGYSAPRSLWRMAEATQSAAA
jgi:hypothetical protein